MKGTHLVRVTKSSGGFPLPLTGVQIETLRLETAQTITTQNECVYICLEQEAVIDVGLDFAHLRPLEAFTVHGTHKISPIGVCVLLRVSTQ
jgi:hypothetical protein